MTETIPTFLKDIVPDGLLPPDLAGLNWNFVRYLREEALERFLKTGLPAVTEEDWRYTNLSSLEKQRWQRVLSTSDIQDTIPSMAGENAVGRLLFVDGYHSRAHARLRRIPPGLHITPLQEALQDCMENVHPFLQEPALEGWHDLNTALFDDGFIIEVDAGVKIDRPLEIVFLSTRPNTPTAHHLRLMVTLGEGAALDLVEIHTGIGSGRAENFATLLSSTHLAPGARLRKVVVQEESAQAERLIHERLRLEDNAGCDLTLLHLGGKLVRHGVQIQHLGEGAKSMLRAVNIADARHVDLLTDMQHTAPNTQSRQEIRALARTKGHAVFQGKVHVAKQAQKTDARQMHRGMLLSEDAEIDSKPSLEIYADDVQCGHGSATGALDEDALFYMQSRGVPRAQAEKMLIEAFVFGLFEEGDLPLREKILDRLKAGWGA